MYKKKRQELAELRAEYGVLSRTEEILKQKNDNVRQNLVSTCLYVFLYRAKYHNYIWLHPHFVSFSVLNYDDIRPTKMRARYFINRFHLIKLSLEKL